MSELKFIIRENVNHTVPTSNSIDATMAQVLYPCFGVVVDNHSHVRNAEVLRQEVLIVVVTAFVIVAIVVAVAVAVIVTIAVTFG